MKIKTKTMFFTIIEYIIVKSKMAFTSSSYLNIIAFLFTTIFYYLALKPRLDLDDLQDPLKKKTYEKKNIMNLSIYLLLVIIIQLIINVAIIISNCGGNITENIGYAGLLTFLPWTLIFGVIIAILIVYPYFKSIFSNVVGYFFISSKATKILVELLINKDIQKEIDKDQNVSQEEKTHMQDAADEILKICGNTSVLINQFTPSNFSEYWSLLNPLMKKRYQESPNSQPTMDLKKSLFELIVTKDNIGEAVWYMYTGFLVTSFILLKITTKECVDNQATMTSKYQSYLKKEENAEQKKKQTTSQTYTITS